MTYNRILSALLALATLLAFCTGCNHSTQSSKKTYGDESPIYDDKSSMTADIQKYYWISDASETDTGSISHYRICVFNEDACMSFDLTRSGEKTLEDMFTDILTELANKDSVPTYESAYALLASLPDIRNFTYKKYSIAYFSEENMIKSVDNSVTWELKNEKVLGRVLKDGTDISYSRFETLNSLESAFRSASTAIKKKQRDAFLAKYSDAPTERDVRYDPYSYFGTDFILTGSAELDDYYNYEFRDLEMVYFCIEVTPTNGSFSDRWYIYGDRRTYTEFFETLKANKKTSVTLVCQIRFPDAGKNQMALLSDYYIG